MGCHQLSETDLPDEFPPKLVGVPAKEHHTT